MPGAVQGSRVPATSGTEDTQTEKTATATNVRDNPNAAPLKTPLMLDRWENTTARVDLPFSEVLQQPNATNAK
ncbi:hypothetical protein DL768_011495 [Monosporascus sp. mg162]|nr:hypothetical protein DL768_011495 [Monosporascus sp. mg162]